MSCVTFLGESIKGKSTALASASGTSKSIQRIGLWLGDVWGREYLVPMDH